MRLMLSVAVVGGVIASTAACGGSTSSTSQAAAAATKTAARSAAVIRRRLVAAGYNDVSRQGFLALLPSIPKRFRPKQAFNVDADFASLHHSFVFSVFVFASNLDATRYAQRIRRPEFRPNPFEPFKVEVSRHLVYWARAVENAFYLRGPSPSPR